MRINFIAAFVAPLMPIQASAQTDGLDLLALPPERCPGAMSGFDALAEEAPSTVLSLVEEAVRRYCAATGGIEMPQSLDPANRAEGSRSAEDSQDTAMPEAVLIAEAAFYLEIAQQVDAGAANDILRRLIGYEPRPGQ